VTVPAGRFGAVQMVDAPALAELAGTLSADFHIALRAGDQAHPGSALLRVAFDRDGDALDEKMLEKVRACFVLGRDRTFEHDPRYGLIALSEIAQRALSPAVNDPGTAIEVIAAQTRLLAGWAEAMDRAARETAAEGRRRLHAPPIEAEALTTLAFRGVARDGAGLVEVGERLQAALTALAETAPARLGPAARAARADAAARAAAALDHPADRDAVQAAG
jgi:uncharacterized membrane protein